MLATPLRTHIFPSSHHAHFSTSLLPRMNVDRAMELYEKACELTHSRLELSQCIAAYEMAKMQVKVCADLGVKLEDVMKTAENKLRQSMAAQM